MPRNTLLGSKRTQRLIYAHVLDSTELYLKVYGAKRGLCLAQEQYEEPAKRHIAHNPQLFTALRRSYERIEQMARENIHEIDFPENYHGN